MELEFPLVVAFEAEHPGIQVSQMRLVSPCVCQKRAVLGMGAHKEIRHWREQWWSCLNQVVIDAQEREFQPVASVLHVRMPGVGFVLL